LLDLAADIKKPTLQVGFFIGGFGWVGLRQWPM
jgi:hypothetical protein